MFLTAAELEQLTGLRQGKAQIRWLQRNRISHFVRADGKPAVTHQAVSGTHIEVKREPNWAALRGQAPKKKTR